MNYDLFALSCCHFTDGNSVIENWRDEEVMSGFRALLILTVFRIFIHPPVRKAL